MKIFIKIILVISYFFIVYVGANAICKLNYNSSKDKYCGTVIEKFSEDRFNKSNYSHTDRYLRTNFGSNGIHTVLVELNTYYNSPIGSSVCFDLSKYEMDKSKPISTFETMCFIGMFIITVLLIIEYLINKYVFN